MVRGAWSLDLSVDAFLDHARAKAGDRPVSELHVHDLAIAWGAVRGDREASKAIARALDDADGVLVRIVGSREAAREIKQSVLAAIVLPRDGRDAELLEYGGRGPLAAWLRVVVIRAAQRAAQRARRATNVEDVLLARVASTPDVAEIVAKTRDGAAVAGALRDALEALEPRKRTLLRYQILDGLGVSEIGVIYGVHRATAARWVADARSALAAAMRRLLAERLRLTQTEVDSLVGFVDSQVDASLERLLAGA